ncbi:MAG TPA: hypothetical protein VK190_02555 [Pseudoneobacillus sp.]|nr:hypothetical protein [Pseudoneobacillus sp.]
MEQKLDENIQLVISMKLATDTRFDFKLLRHGTRIYYAIRNKDTSFPIYHIYCTHISNYYKNSLVFTFLCTFTKVDNVVYVCDYSYGGERRFSLDIKFDNGMEYLKHWMKDTHFDVKASLRKMFKFIKNKDGKLFSSALCSVKMPEIEPSSKFVIDYHIDIVSAVAYKVINGGLTKMLYKDQSLQNEIINAYSQTKYGDVRSALIKQLYPEFFGGDDGEQVTSSNGTGNTK